MKLKQLLDMRFNGSTEAFFQDIGECDREHLDE